MSINNITHPDFGKNFDFNDFIREIYKLIKNPVNRVDAQLILTQLYETKIGIFDHVKRNPAIRPLASNAFLPIHDTFDGSKLHIRMKQYIDLKIKDVWGYTFREWLDNTSEHVEMTIELASLERNKKANIGKDIINDLEKGTK